MSQLLQNLALKNLPVAFMRKRLAKVAASTRPSLNTDSQLLIDLSVICEGDAGTGIQRVVRNLYHELLAAPPAGYRVCPIAATRERGYCYLPTDFLQEPAKWGAGIFPVAVRVDAGDLFVGLDLAAHIVPQHLGALLRWKRKGVRMQFFVYDILPVREPAWFNPGATRNFKRWLRAIALLGDGVITMSRVVEADFAAWMQRFYGLDQRDLPCTSIQPGAELDVMHASRRTGTGRVSLMRQCDQSRFVLMVGTIEPRKGHADVLDAFEKLWVTGNGTKLIIAGKRGWKVDALMQRLKSHPEGGRRLHWLDSPDDEMLQMVYENCCGLIMASKGEGFGLPLIEAAYLGKPVLLRDIPVFREIAGNGACYFSSTGPNNLIQVLPQWLSSLGEEYQGPMMSLTGVTWKESCRQLARALLPAAPHTDQHGYVQAFPPAFPLQKTARDGAT